MVWDVPVSSTRQSGITGGGVGGIRPSVHADVARHRRNRKDKTLPLINADDTDLESRYPRQNGMHWDAVM